MNDLQQHQRGQGHAQARGEIAEGIMTEKQWPTDPVEIQARVSDAVCVAVAKWGSESQWRMVQEECGELIAAVNQFARSRIGADAVASEVADVIIMMGQARLMLGEELVDSQVLKKLARLEVRVGIVPEPLK
jgi:NTP pyrophosphatase (non-canonical NTP hydrolase)